MDDWIGCASGPRFQELTLAPKDLGLPGCAFSRGVTIPFRSPLLAWRHPASQVRRSARLASVDFLAVFEEKTPRGTTSSTAMAAPASRKSERLRSRPSSRRFVTWCSRRALSKA